MNRTEKKVEAAVRAAFTKNIPDFPESVLAQCSDRKGTVITMTEHKRKKQLKAILIAAVLTVVFAVTVTAVNLSGLIEPEQAIKLAYNYVVKNETDPELQSEIGTAVLLGQVYDNNLGTGEADIGLRAGRIVYNISFKTCGYSFDVVMDAKTGVVYSSEKGIDENWEEMRPKVEEEAAKRLEAFKAEVENSNAESAKNRPTYDRVFLISRFKEHFGLHDYLFSNEEWTSVNGAYQSINGISIDGDEEHRCATCVEKIDGYIYTAVLEYDTGRVVESSVAEDPDYENERVLHEKTEGIISFDEADEIVEKAILSAYPELDAERLLNINVTNYATVDQENIAENFGHAVIIENLTYDGHESTDYFERISEKAFSYTFYAAVNAETGEIDRLTRSYAYDTMIWMCAESLGLDYNMDVYVNSAYTGTGTELATIYLKACNFEDGLGRKIEANTETGEILSVEEYEEEDKDVLVPNQSLSNDAEDGYISESAAASVALEYVGVFENQVYSLTAELEDGVYHISFRYGLTDGSITNLRLNTFEVDAESGEIITCDAINPDDYITPEEAVACAKEHLESYIDDFTPDDYAEMTGTAELMSRSYDYYKVTLTLGDFTTSMDIDPLTGDNLNFIG